MLFVWATTGKEYSLAGLRTADGSIVYLSLCQSASAVVHTSPIPHWLTIMNNPFFVLRAKGWLWICWALLVPHVFSFQESRLKEQLLTAMLCLQGSMGRGGQEQTSIPSCLVSEFESHSYLLPFQDTISFSKAGIRALGSSSFISQLCYLGPVI